VVVETTTSAEETKEVMTEEGLTRI
jgi:hypothetical protein